MLGRGLAEIQTHTLISHTLVHQIVHSIGVNTQRRAKIGIMLSSFIIVDLLGTLAGSFAKLAPSFRVTIKAYGLYSAQSIQINTEKIKYLHPTMGHVQ